MQRNPIARPFAGLRLFALTLSLLLTPALAQSQTPGFDFNVDATTDVDGDSRWEDTVGTTGFDFELDTGNGVSRMTGVSALPGIGAAYDFPGGFTGNSGGALLSSAGSGSRRSFQNASGDWSNEDVTIEVWFKPGNLTPTPSNGQTIFEDGGGTGFGFFVDNNELRLRKAGGNGNVNSNIAGISGEFIQAVGTYDVSAGEMELFINGLPVGTDNPGGGDWTGGDAAAVGTRGGSNTGGIGGGQQNTESFQGQISIFRVYRNQILDPLEVGDNYTAVSGVTLYDDFFWDGSNANWGDVGPTNWLDDTGASTASVPGNFDQAFVTDGTANVNAAQEAFTLDIGVTAGPPAATPPIPAIGNPIVEVDDTLTIGVSTDIGATGELNINNGGDFTTDTISAAAGSIVSVDNGGSLTVSSSGTIDQLNLEGGATTAGTFTATNTTITGNTVTHTSGTATLNGVSSSGGLVKNGNGTVRLDTNNSLTGTTTINDGVLFVTNGGALGGGTITAANGGTLKLQGSITLAQDISLDGNGNGGGEANAALFNNNNTNNIDGQVTTAGNTRIRVDNGRLRLRGGLAANNNIRIEVDNNQNFEIRDNPITGGGELTFEGDGTTEIRVASPGFSGVVDINNGVVDTNNAQGLGTNTVQVDGDATLRLRNNINVANNIDLSGGANNGNGEGNQGRIRNDAGNNTLSGTIAVNADSRIDVDSGSTLSLSGVVSGGGDINKTDTGRLNLTNTGNSFTGALSVGGGTVGAAGNGSLGSPSSISVANGATLEVNNVGTIASSLSISGDGDGGVGAINATGGTNSFTGPVSISGTTITGAAGSQTTFSGPVSLGVTTDVTFNADGEITVSQAMGNGNSPLPRDGFAGMRFDQGNKSRSELRFHNASSSGAYTINPDGTISQGTLLLSNTPDQTGFQSHALNMDREGSTTAGPGTGPFHWVTTFGDIPAVDGNEDRFQVAWTAEFTPDATGDFTFRSRDKNFTGGNVDDDASIYIDADQSGSFESGEGFESNGGGSITVSLMGGQQYRLAIGFREGTGDEEVSFTFQGTAGAFTSETGIIPGDSAQAGLFTSGLITPDNNVEINGTGIVRFDGDNNYNGTTDVNDTSTLIINGTTSGQGDYNVASGATLGGDGTIGLQSGASVIISDAPGVVSPGDAGAGFAGDPTFSAGADPQTVGSLFFDQPDGGVALDLGGILQLDIVDPATFDMIEAINGTINLGPDSLLTINGESDLTQIDYLGLGFSDGDLLTIVESADGIAGTFSNLPEEQIAAGNFGITFGFSDDGTSFFLQATNAVPEPSTVAIWVLLGVVGAAFAWRRRRGK